MSDFRNRLNPLGGTGRINPTTPQDPQTRRQEHANELIENYVKQLVDYRGAEQKFRKSVEPLVNQYVSTSMPDRVFDAQVADKFNHILTQAKKDSENDERTTYANQLVESYASQFVNYPGYDETFRVAVSNLVSLYINGSISKNQFESQVEEKFNEIMNEAINTNGGKIDSAEKERRTEYANSLIDKCVKKLEEFEGAVEKFKEAVNSIVSQYLNGVIEDDDEFKEKIKKEYKAIYNEEVTKARTERSNYAYGEVDTYADQLSEYEGAGDKFRNAVQDLVDDYIAAKITKSEFDEGIKAKFEEILETEKTSSEELGDIELFEYTEDTKENRYEYLRSVIEQYSKALHGYPFRNAINDLAVKFAHKRITKEEFDEKIKEIFTKIYNSIADSEEITEEDGSKIVKVKDAQGRVIAETKCDKNGNKVYEKTYEYNENGLVQKRVDVEYDEDGNFSILTYDRKTGAIKRQLYYVNTCPFNWLIEGDEFQEYDLAFEQASIYLRPGKVTKKGYGSMNAFDLYQLITVNLNKKGPSFPLSTRSIIETIAGDFTCALLEAAQIGKGAPTSIGCDKTFETYQNTGKYADYIRQELYNALHDTYGYEPEDVKGYHFPADSDICKAMSTDPDMANFVKKNIKSLLNGNLPLNMAFNKTKDLYYSVHGCSVIDSNLSGTTLTLTLFDIYDFDYSNVEIISAPGYNPEKDVDANGNSLANGHALNAAGAMAMKNGTLKPYYELFEVKIDLTKLFSEAQLKELGVL